MNTFNLERVERKKGKGQTGCQYFEYIINGKPLLNFFEGIVEIGVLGSFGEKNDNDAALQLLKMKPSELDTDRVPLYICPECGDLGCGAVTVKVLIKENCFTWSDFGYENNNEEGLLESYNIGPFYFDKDEYQLILNKFLT